MNRDLTPKEKEILVRWIEHVHPRLRTKGWGTWDGKRPPVFAVHIWHAYGGDAAYALECSHGFRGLAFLNWNYQTDKAASVPGCLRCLARANRWEARRKENELSRRKLAKFNSMSAKLLKRKWLQIFLGGFSAIVLGITAQITYESIKHTEFVQFILSIFVSSR